MGIFRRKGSEADVESIDDQIEVEDQADGDAAGDAAEDAEATPEPATNRDAGPWDISEWEANPDEVTRLDLGGILMPGVDGMQLQMQSESEGGPILAVTAILGSSAMQVQPFAAPKSGGYWSTVREEILGQLDAASKAREVEGAFGIELQAIIPAVSAEGEQIAQPARFVGIDGPRWFLRAVFLGDAALDAAAGADLEAVLRHVVVRRGAEAMAPGTPIAMTYPEEVPQGIDPVEAQQAQEDEAPVRDDLNPFERGPEITEIR